MPAHLLIATLAAANTALFVNTRIISRRYSGVSADVVSGLAIFAARSPTSAANTSFIVFPASNSPAAFTSKERDSPP